MNRRLGIGEAVWRLAGRSALAIALLRANLAGAQGPLNPADPQNGALYGAPGSVGYGAPYQPGMGANPVPGMNFQPGPPPIPTQSVRPSSWVGGGGSAAPADPSDAAPANPPRRAAGGSAQAASLPGAGAPVSGYAPANNAGYGPANPNPAAPGAQASYANSSQASPVPVGPAGFYQASAGAAPVGGLNGPPGPLTPNPQPPSFNFGPAGAPPAAASPTPVPAPKHAYDAEIGPAKEEFTGTEIIAWVGQECILSGDLLPQVNEIIEKNKSQIPPEQVDATRRKLLKDYLKPLIETKLIFADAKRKLPKENMPKIQTQVDEVFDKENIPKMMTEFKLKTRGELNERLRQGGSSLEKQRQAFFERAVASQFIHQQCKSEFEITHEQMLDYYYAHISSYETPARARWEQICVRFDKHASRAEAWQVLAGWGNEILAGRSLAEMAKQHSEAAFAEDGLHDWTNKGSIRSAELDRAIFTLPVGALSQIIEDERGLSIIRVVEREDLKRKPFPETQAEIKKKITDARTEQEMDRYIQKLRERTPVRTVFDDPNMSPLATRTTGALQ